MVVVAGTVAVDIVVEGAAGSGFVARVLRR